GSNDYVSNVAGNPLSWVGEVINGYGIYPYYTSVGSGLIYNYDGLASKWWWGQGAPAPYTHFSYVDTEENINYQPASPIIRNNVFTWGLPSNMQCNGGNCEDTNLLPESLRDDIRFSGKGLLGGGGYLLSTNEELSTEQTTPQGQTGD